MPKEQFEKDLTSLINTHGVDAHLDEYDSVLARFLISCLESYKAAVEGGKMLRNNDVDGKQHEERFKNRSRRWR